jgi:N utilization substance protein B
MQLLYGHSFVLPETGEDLAAGFAQAPEVCAGKMSREALDFTWELVSGVHENREALDEVIQRFSRHWKLGRIAKVELSILRLAIFEMLHREDIPLKVAINEAVEMAKNFGDENSRNFVNGILDACAKAVVQGEFGIHKEF